VVAWVGGRPCAGLLPVLCALHLEGGLVAVGRRGVQGSSVLPMRQRRCSTPSSPLLLLLLPLRPPLLLLLWRQHSTLPLTHRLSLAPWRQCSLLPRRKACLLPPWPSTAPAAALLALQRQPLQRCSPPLLPSSQLHPP
jgi:hypothetical protein